MKEFEAKVRLNEENGGKTGELDIMSQPPFDKGYFNGVTFGITFKDPMFEAEKKSGWIPCSERLPEKDGKYLVTAYGYVSKKNNNVTTAIFVSTTKEFYPNCIAWMPLPEPYRGEDEPLGS